MPSIEEAAAAIARKRAQREAKTVTRHAKKGFYASAAWRRLRYAVIRENAKRNGGVPSCEVCGAKRGPDVRIHVDHIEPVSKNWARRLDRTNLQVACEDCNLGKSNTDSIDWRTPKTND